MNAPRARYASADAMGIALGVVLLLSFIVAGRGIGASGAFAVVVGSAMPRSVTSDTDQTGWRGRLPDGVPGTEWIVWEVVGIAVGAAISAQLAGRLATGGAPVSRVASTRALAGGALMGLGARLAYGCTSGLALSGGALMATGAFVFMLVAFATAVVVARLTAGHADDASSLVPDDAS